MIKKIKKLLTRKEPLTFTKIMVCTIVLLYIIGAALGILLVITAAIMDMHLNRPIDSAMFIALGAYIGGPTIAVITFYIWKSKAENLLKIKNKYPSDSTIVPALAGMEGS